MNRDRLIVELEKRTGLPSPAVGRLLDELVSLACEEAAQGFILPGLCEIRLVSEADSGAALPGKDASGLKKLIMTPLPVAIKLAQRSAAAARPTPMLSPEAPKPEFSAPELAAASGATAAASASEEPLDEELPPGLYSFPCPACGALVDAVPSMVGEKADCPFCSRGLRVPPPTATGGGSSAPSIAEAPTPFFSFRCSHCGEEMEMRSNRIGAEVDCPFCGVKLRVPSAGEDTRQALSSRASSNAARPIGGALDEVMDRLMHSTVPPMPTPSPAMDKVGSQAGVKLTSGS